MKPVAPLWHLNGSYVTPSVEAVEHGVDTSGASDEHMRSLGATTGEASRGHLEDGGAPLEPQWKLACLVSPIFCARHG